MVRVDLRDCEGDLVASIDTAEGVIPRVGETIRVIDIDYKVEFVRWTLTDEGTSVQVMVHQEPKAALWPEGAPDPDNIRPLFKDKE
jgi:hypothetical protein